MTRSQFSKFWLGGPQSAPDRARLQRLPAESQHVTGALAYQVFREYRGWRTAASCWVQALNEIEVGNEPR